MKQTYNGTPKSPFATDIDRGYQDDLRLLLGKSYDSYKELKATRVQAKRVKENVKPSTGPVVVSKCSLISHTDSKSEGQKAVAEFQSASSGELVMFSDMEMIKDANSLSSKS